MHERDLAKKPFTIPEIHQLLAGRSPAEFINPKSTPYKALGLAEQQLSDDQLIELLAKEVNLFKRPILIKNGTLHFGFSESEYQQLIK